MILDKELCIGCEGCLSYCPMGAIHMVDGYAHIDRDECVECGVCLRSVDCPTGAFRHEELSWPRSLREAFSNPIVEHKETRIPGRGTAEMKTNEVTGRFRRGYAGMAVELGRPGLGTRFREVEKVTKALAALGADFEPLNPLTHLLADQRSGVMRDGILEEKVLSAIIEFTVPLGKVPSVISTLKEVEGAVDTVFSVEITCRLEADGSVPTLALVESLGVLPYPNGKTNVGLGRPLAEEVAP